MPAVYNFKLPPDYGIATRATIEEMASGVVPHLYENTEVLWNEMKACVDFQGNLDYYEKQSGTPYCHTLVLYKDINSERKFICKNDLFLYIQKKVVELESMMNNNLSLTVLSYFLRSEELKLNGTCEFVEFDEEEFQKLDEELAETTKFMNENIARLNRREVTAENMLARFLRLLPVEEKNTTKLKGVLEQMFEFKELEENRALAMCVLLHSHLALLIPAIQKIIAKRPEWFKPVEKKTFAGEEAKENTKLELPAPQFKQVFRLFKAGDFQFVFSSDIQDFLKTIAVVERPEKTHLIKVMEYSIAKQTLEQHGAKEGDVVFIPVAVKRIQGTSQHIRTGAGTFAKPSADHFFEVFRDLFFTDRVFHANQPQAWRAFEELMSKIKAAVFIPEAEIYFHESQFMNAVEHAHRKVIAENRLERPSIRIRPLVNTGFTTDHLAEELKNLTVDSYFPDILEHVNAVYGSLTAKKNAGDLTIRDFNVGVEHCMLNSVLKKWPWTAQYLHNQCACHRVMGWVCEKCEEDPAKKEFGVKMYQDPGDVEDSAAN